MQFVMQFLGYSIILGVSLLMIYAFVKVLLYALSAIEDSNDD